MESQYERTIRAAEIYLGAERTWEIVGELMKTTTDKIIQRHLIEYCCLQENEKTSNVRLNALLDFIKDKNTGTENKGTAIALLTKFEDIKDQTTLLYELFDQVDEETRQDVEFEIIFNDLSERHDVNVSDIAQFAMHPYYMEKHEEYVQRTLAERYEKPWLCDVLNYCTVT